MPVRERIASRRLGKAKCLPTNSGKMLAGLRSGGGLDNVLIAGFLLLPELCRAGSLYGQVHQ